MEDPTTEEFRALQSKREQDEREKAEDSSTPDETDQHAKRADKAAYLREKLEERAAAERKADSKGKRRD
jgi:hypothetical protein